MDFLLIAKADCREFELLNVIGRHSRLYLIVRVGRRYKAKEVV